MKDFPSIKACTVFREINAFKKENNYRFDEVGNRTTGRRCDECKNFVRSDNGFKCSIAPSSFVTGCNCTCDRFDREESK